MKPMTLLLPLLSERASLRSTRVFETSASLNSVSKLRSTAPTAVPDGYASLGPNGESPATTRPHELVTEFPDSVS